MSVLKSSSNIASSLTPSSAIFFFLVKQTKLPDLIIRSLMKSYQKFYNLMKQMKIIALQEGDINISRIEDTSYIDESRIVTEIISENGDEDMNNEEEKYIFE